MIALDEPPAVLVTGLSRWLGEAAVEITGPLRDIVPRLPAFDRVPFGANPRLDMIVRRAAAPGEIPVPTGVVSKGYVLVQHLAVIDALVKALGARDVEALDLRCRLTITESGARMAVRVELPPAFAFTPSDGHTMALTFECFNSVDRTVPLFALLGWFRFVCRNGLVIGTTHARMWQQHRASLRIEDLEPILAEGLVDAERDRDALTGLTKARVTTAALCAWVDGPLADAWGPLAAARVHAIASRGIDGEPSRAPRRARPHERAILKPRNVPGVHAPCENRYDAAQALAWVAARRNDVAQGLAWRNQIPELVGQL